jgi:2,4-dienoyl-CoA reductase-like NADH-dependent reductase (Old Yellow Enzyme family)/thioredoxin reductase
VTYGNLLRPGRIGAMPLRNRIIGGPMERSLCHPDGSLSERYIAYARERARGGAALLQLESAYVAPEGRGNPYQLGVHGDHTLPGLTRIAEAVHEHGAKLAMELNHGGRQSSIAVHQRQPLAPSALASTFMDPGTRPRTMTLDDIARVTDDFVRAAERCLRAGVDMIHLHGAHGYLLGQFLSPQANRRSDRYGGSLENRARLALEVLAAVRAAVGPDVPIGYRLSAREYVEGGLELDESTLFALMLAEAGIDLIDVAGGTYESMTMIFQTAEAPRGGFVADAAAVRRAVGARVPVSVAQRMNDPVFADAAMAEHGFAFVTLARALHADPHYPRKLAEGRPEAIVPCIACNTCVNLTVAHTPAGCAANPRSTFEGEPSVGRAARPQRVWVVGGGVAGLQAARALALQGQRVVLHEAQDRLGGQLDLCRAALPDYAALADWLEREVRSLGVEVRLESAVTIDGVRAADPDAVVVATGARGGALWADLVDPIVPVIDAFAALAAPPEVGTGAVAVLGGDHVSCFLARHLARRGASVHLFAATADFADDWGFNGLLLALELRDDPRIVLHPETTVERIAGDRLRYQRRLEEGELEVSAVVVGGRASENALSEGLKRAGFRGATFTIGDAVRPRDLYRAGRDAVEVADRIGLASGAGLRPI